MSEVLNKANEYVSNLEEKHLEEMYQEMDRLNNSSCKCPQCTKYKYSLHQSILDEEDRIDFFDLYDHEEDYLFYLALSRLEGNG